MAKFDVKAEDEYYKAIIDLVKLGGNIIREVFVQPRSATNVLTKSSSVDLVTETDKRVEKLLFTGLQKQFPDHKFIGEESNAEGAKIEWTDSPTWIIDPIDGTTNFVHRIPFVCIAVGLCVNKQIRIGIVYNPISKELWSARANQGAFKNGFPISVSGTKELGKSVATLSWGIHNMATYPNSSEIYMQNATSLIKAGIRGHRSLGSAAINMAMVAEGCLDCFFEFGLHCWDMAGAALIITEAGGVVTDPKGGEFEMMSRRCLRQVQRNWLRNS